MGRMAAKMWKELRTGLTGALIMTTRYPLRPPRLYASKSEEEGDHIAFYALAEDYKLGLSPQSSVDCSVSIRGWEEKRVSGGKYK